MDFNQMVSQLNEHNLCTYFILPLAGVSKSKFGGDLNFIDTYLKKDLTSIYVEVFDSILVQGSIPKYTEFTDENNKVYLEFSINPNFKSDVEKFVEGKYSQFSNRAKTIIRTNSGLMYRTVVGLTSRTDIRLLALDKSPLLKELWDEFLDLDVGEETELLSKPTDTFLEVNLLPK
jgi:hypothetical protein